MSAALGWTGAQYSLFRVALGSYLGVHFAQLLPWGTELFSDQGALADGAASPLLGVFPNLLGWIDTPIAVAALLLVGLGLSVLFAAGFRDRLAAVALWYVWACLFGRNPLIANPSLPFVGWLLLAHAALPRAPYGSWERRADPDPGLRWAFPRPIFTAAWVVMAAAYSYSGYTKLLSPSWLDGSALAHVLENPLARPTFLRSWLLALPPGLLAVATWAALALELGFAPLALVARLRPFLWLAMVAMHVGLMFAVDFADLSVGMLLVHGFTFDPAWLPRRMAARPETVFYDGDCALCHAVVRFFLAEDRSGALFRFAPLQSAAFRSAGGTPGEHDTWILQTEDGRLLERSAALLFVTRRLGGVWRALGLLAGVIPERARDAVYGVIASTRYRVFGTKTDACPLVSAPLRDRFLP